MTNQSKKYSGEQIDQWKRAINAIPIVASRVPGQREGDEFVTPCPFHKNGKEKTPSFKVWKTDEGVWLVKCFGCGWNGNAFQFVQKFDKLTFNQAVEKVLEQAGTIDSNAVESKPKSKKLVTFSMSQYAQAERELEGSPAGQKWITGRGITMETARRFHLGFVQDAVAVCGTDHPWRDKGWITIPTLSASAHRVFTIKYRSLVAKKETIHGKPVSGILRAQDMPTTMFNFRELNALITTNMVTGRLERNDLQDVFITEGEPDTMVLSQTGTPTVGLPSASYVLHPDECAVLKHAKRIFIAGDSDKEGQKAANRLWKELGANAFLIRWPEGIKDANDMLLQTCLGRSALFQSMLDDLKAEAIERGEWREATPPKETKRESAAPPPPAPCADQTASSIKPKRVKWLWQDRIPLGKITLFAGNPDNGKSLAAIDLAARVTTGSPFPDGVNTFPPSDVLMMLGEDDLEDTAVPRLMAAGANRDFIHFLETTTGANGFGQSEIRLDEDLPHVEASLQKYPNARLLVIDPISNYLGRASMVSEQEVREKILMPLKRLAEKHRVAVVLIMHLNKKSDLEAISRVGGAMAFVGVARASWLFIRDASSEEGEIKDSFSMARIKSNLTKASSGGTAYHIQSSPVMTDDDGEVFAPYVVWDGVVQKSADDVMASHHANKHEGPGRHEGSDKKLQRAIHWLQTTLASGYLLSDDVFDRADEEEGIKEITLRRAAKTLGIQPHQRKGVGWVWELSPMNATAASVAAADGDRTETDAISASKEPPVEREFGFK